MLWLLLLLFETPQEHADRLRTQMQASLAAQRDSVRKQSELVRAASPYLPPVLASRRAWIPPRSVMFKDQPACDPLPAPELASLVDTAAREQNVNPFLIKEVARQESGFRPCAVSNQGAMGVMQLMPATQIELGVSDPWDARRSIEAGSHLLRQLLDRYHGDVSLALSAYNAGAGTVDHAGGVPAIPETRNYVDSILYRLLSGTGSPPVSGTLSPGLTPTGLFGAFLGGLNDEP